MENIFKKLVGDKKEYREYKERVAKLPHDYSVAYSAIERYMYNFAAGDGIMKVIYDGLSIFEQAAADQAPLKDVVGENPVEFAADLMSNYPEQMWIVKQQDKLRKTIKELE